jgi:PTH1 family peptidyl-tRNA hydrolase
MKLIVGLGNPGPQYETTRHNAGFLMVDELIDHFKFEPIPPKFKAELWKGNLLGHQALILKPQTFMNLSGQSVAEAVRFFKVPANDIIVLHDELDMASGVVKTRVGGGPGGHNGIRSLIKELGHGDFHRMKLGIGRPTNPEMSVTNWVLGPYTDEEILCLQEKMLKEVLLRLENILKN